MLTVERLLADMGLAPASGKDAACAAVRWVHSTELIDPTPWLTGGEVLLSTGIQLDGEAVQREFVERLVEHGIAALGFGTGFTHDRIPAALLARAQELCFPVFEVPYELPFIAITERAFTYLVNEQYEAMRRSIEIQGRLERLVLDERGLEPVVRVAAGAIRATVLVLSPRGEPIACSGALPDDLEGLERGASERDAFEPREGALALPVAPRDGASPQAWLLGVRDAGPLGDFERLILQQTVTIVALELMRQRVQRDTERRFAGDVLTEALTGRLHPEELDARLRPFGIGRRAAVLVFALADAAAGEPLLDRVLAKADVRGLVATRGELLCAVVDADATDPLELARVARSELALQFGDVRAAASRAAEAGSLRRSFHEARCALQAARLAGDSGPEVASHRDLGSFELLLSLQDDDALRTYSENVLGSIHEGENGYGEELLRSLEVFIEQNGQWERAARRLYCHRHTLRYRIRRIEELTGRDLGSARDRIDFWLALQARELVR
jgi:purine catabolism regulator